MLQLCSGHKSQEQQPCITPGAHEISNFISSEKKKKKNNEEALCLSSAAVVVGTLRVKFQQFIDEFC